MRFFSHVGKKVNKKAKVNFNFYDVTDWTASNEGNNVGKRLDEMAKVNFKICDSYEWTAKTLFKLKANGQHFSFNTF